MQAAVISSFGPPEVLVAADVAEPQPGPGDVLLDVQVASITFVETQLRNGTPPHAAMAPALPAILGNGVGGRVAAVGDGVDPAHVGREAITTTGGSGGYAERVAVPAAGLIEVPENLSLDHAVALLADGRTAVSLMRVARVRRGERVLVLAAAGGVGTLLVQLTRNAGAHVVAAAGGERKLAVARELGARETADYARPGWQAAIAPVDLVFDGVGGAIGRAAFELVRRGGRYLHFGMAGGAFTEASDEEANARGVTVWRGQRPTPQQMREDSIAALTIAAGGRLRPVIGQTFPLHRAADAHAAIEARRTIGKTLLQVRSDG